MVVSLPCEHVHAPVQPVEEFGQLLPTGFVGVPLHTPHTSLGQVQVLGVAAGQELGDEQVPHECPQGSVPQLLEPQVLGQVQVLGVAAGQV